LRPDPNWRLRLEAQVREQLPADRDLERGLYSADDFLRYDLTDQLMNYLAAAFDVLEIIEVGYRRLRVDNAVTVESFDLVARADDDDPTLVIPVLVSIWTWEPDLDQPVGNA
jgi:hypothetical protein